ncbi:MAG: hypothetical protein R6U51_09000 [Anaerolineales bacterium]
MKKQIYWILLSVLVISVTVLSTACGMDSAPSTTDVPPDTQSSTAVSPSHDQATEDSEEGRPFAPQAGDQDLERGDVQLEKIDLLIMESWPVQISLQVEGNLPTPCHQLRAKISEKGDDQRVDIEIYSLTDPEQMCAQVLEPFEVNIPLGSFKDEGISFWVNGEKVGEY